MSKLYAAIPLAMLLFGGRITQAPASQVLTIPCWAALATAAEGDSCINNYPHQWQSGPNGCALMFPLNIPVGHVIHQISVLRSTDQAPAPAPFYQASLEVTDLQSINTQDRFLWNSDTYVPVNTIENHRLMQQTKLGYPEEFAVAPNTNYQVMILMSEGAYTFGVQVVYD